MTTVRIELVGPAGTMRLEVSPDGREFHAMDMVTAQATSPLALAPRLAPDRVLPDGWHWCEIHEKGEPVRFAAMPDVDCGRAC
jgi:hypothetical protein